MTGSGTVIASIAAGAATDAAGNANTASTSTDNMVTVTLTLSRPDLVTLHAIYPTGPGTPSVNRGNAVTVAEITFNAGAAASGPSVTRYYLSPDAALSASDRPLVARAIGPLATGAIQPHASFNVVIPASTVPGNYYLLAVADADRTVVESNEANNVSARPLRVQ